MFFRHISSQLRAAAADIGQELKGLNCSTETAQPTFLTEAHFPDQLISSYQRVIVEAQLPPELNVHRLAELAKQMPVRSCSSREPGFRIGDIRRKGIIQFQHDSADNIREDIVQLLKEPTVVEFFSSQFGERRYASDCQLHRMSAGSALAEHSHGIDDIFVVFHFERSYGGGLYFEREGYERTYPDIKPFSACVSRFAVPHGVEEVLWGERIVLVTSWEYSSHKR